MATGLSEVSEECQVMSRRCIWGSRRQDVEGQLRILTQKTQTPCWELPKEVSWLLGERPLRGSFTLGELDLCKATLGLQL